MPAKDVFHNLLTSFTLTRDKVYNYYDLSKLDPVLYNQLPYSIRVLLESAVRNCDDFEVKQQDVQNILNWRKMQTEAVEIPFKPARVILQDFTGVPAVVDFAAMRDAVKRLGGDPDKINPICPADLVIDHSVEVDVSKSPTALQQNQEIEFQRNKERFTFLKWGAKALRNMLIVPPGSGIIHQVNLEYLARVMFFEGSQGEALVYPDSLVGTDSHTTMINGLGVVGWGVGGIEAEAVMLGQTISMVLPPVVGYRIIGKLSSMATSTDLVLTITKHLRSVGVVGKFVEFYGPGVSQLSIADRATISNMCPEYGATVGYFPVDDASLKYLQQTGRAGEDVEVMAEYFKKAGLLRDYTDASHDPMYSEETCHGRRILIAVDYKMIQILPDPRQIVELDLGQVVPCVSGPKRPHDKVPLSNMKFDFNQCLSNPLGFKGYQLKEDQMNSRVTFTFTDGLQYELCHGSVVIAAITSCTNTSNPSVMLGAGLLAKRAVEAGLKVKPYIKTSLSPGSGVVTYYLKESGLLEYLEKLDFNLVGYGCMTCIGNSGPLDESLSSAIEKGDLVVAGVLSGNRNFEGRIHPNTRANYLASPLLVVAYALAGTVAIDFEIEPLGKRVDGTDVYLRDVWPSRDEIAEVEKNFVLPKMFKDVYSNIQNGSTYWNSLQAPEGQLYPWDESSTYIKSPPFFQTMEASLPSLSSIVEARVLLKFGDSVTTDHISPAGSIARNSPAAKYLSERGLSPKEFNSYGSRRGNDAVMSRGTFANIRLVNKLVPNPGPKTLYMPTNEIMDIYEAAERYKSSNIPVIILAGKEYGSGSSRDWAAKGPSLLGIKAVIAESYERIHRSNLVGMGIIPLQFLPNQNADTLNLTGQETYTIHMPDHLHAGHHVTVQLQDGRTFEAIARFDTEVELVYYRNGGILNYMVRRML
ncbi:hypothetical protein HELRODRAFT_189761 [Helobdella robusta]|uniref:Cytoplasmic aconitate hydratase n=1 Tax=Helobdella robusta TaxID=6412 RepID=T1FRC6_HELRO|nr:hypothetical protein HELRODRAFT_189761 [Helobdella robusta]ESN91664.1 hypothetical protein HELRODRAFT_189761 [Helobdella robusta]